MAYAKDYSLADVYAGQPDLVVISPNDPTAMTRLSQECRERGIRFLADPSQQIPRFDGDQLHAVVDVPMRWSSTPMKPRFCARK